MCTNQELQMITKDVVDAVVESFKEKINKIVLYGSYARGDFTSESDVDIMIVLNCTKEEVSQYRKQINKFASRIGLEHDIMVSILLRDKQTFMDYQDDLPFYKNVTNEGVKLYG